MLFSYQECVVKNYLADQNWLGVCPQLFSLVKFCTLTPDWPWRRGGEGRGEIMGILGFSRLNLPSIKRVGSAASFLFVDIGCSRTVVSITTTSLVLHTY